MSLESILAAIEASGEVEVARLGAEAAARAQQIVAEAELKAVAIQEAARQPAAGERARRLHQAKLVALRLVGEVRQRLVEAALAETRRRLASARASPDYALRLLIQEALSALGSAELAGGWPLVEVDPRDEALARRILDELGVDLAIVSALHCWGGVVVRSGDGRVVVTNTLEARLERAIPFLRRDLAIFLRDSPENQERWEVAIAP
ncbi:MAG: hypothetical protein HY335_04650 [Deinococcus sp.]|nr:hypothetical protein [Deinococcus sp.]